MGSNRNSDPYQLLCLFKIIEGIRALRVRRQREATRRGRAIAARTLVAPETIPNDSVEFVPWLERIYPVRTSPWDEMAVGSVFISEVRGRTIAALVEPGDRELQRPPGPLCALRNQIAHSIGPGSQPLIADEALHSQQVLHWLPITKCVVRLLLANEFPDELWTPASRREVLSRLVRAESMLPERAPPAALKPSSGVSPNGFPTCPSPALVALILSERAGVLQLSSNEKRSSCP